MSTLLIILVLILLLGGGGFYLGGPRYGGGGIGLLICLILYLMGVFRSGDEQGAGQGPWQTKNRPLVRPCSLDPGGRQGHEICLHHRVCEADQIDAWEP